MSKNKFVFKENHVEMILTSKGKEFVCKIDLDDYEKVSSFPYKWGILSNSKDGFTYVRAIVPKGNIRTTLLLHRFLSDCEGNKVVDHINHDVFDNRKENLRTVSQLDNMQNMKQEKPNKYGNTRGVAYDKKHQKWRVRRMYKGEIISFGYFRDYNDAVQFKRLLEVIYRW